MTRYDTSTRDRRMAKHQPQKPYTDDEREPTPEEKQRCAETWARVKREIEDSMAATRMPRKSKYSPPLPENTAKVDISDFPPSNASPQELRDWEARQKAGEAA